MTEQTGEHIAFDVLIERDINILLLEELRLSTEFQSWIVNKLSNGKKSISRFVNATHLAQYGEFGSVDILFLFEDESNRRCAFLIENKLDRPQEKVKAERFFEYGEKGRIDGAWDEYVTCLVAPADYFTELNENEYFSGYLSYEDLTQWFAYAQTADPSLPPHRAAYKEQLMSFALHQWNSIMSGLAQNRKTTFSALPVAPPNAKKQVAQMTGTFGAPSAETVPVSAVQQQPAGLATQPVQPAAPVYPTQSAQSAVAAAPAAYVAQQPSVSSLMNVDDLSNTPVYPQQTQPVQQPAQYAPADSYSADPYPDMRQAAGYAQQAAQTALFDTSTATPAYEQPFASVYPQQTEQAPYATYPTPEEALFDMRESLPEEENAPSSKDFSDFKLYPGGILNLPKDYREEDDSVMKVFAKQYHDFSMENFAQLNMQPLTPATEEKSIIEFIPAEFAQDIKILHHLTDGIVELAFLHTPLAAIEPLYKPALDADMSFKETQGAALIRIGMPAIDPQRGLESQKDLADFALKKAHKLYLMYLKVTGAGVPQNRTAAPIKSSGKNARGSSSKKNRREYPATTPDDLIL